ncbi:MAG: PaaI family thioesterase [Clostridia bacterium]|nr:PaaI family thioesterase [Clostridia bacterium]
MKVISKQTNSKMCLICGLENNLGLKADFYNMEDNSVGAIFTFKEVHQSYPGRVHGGMISALLDELAGRALWVTDPELFGVTATMTIKFRKPVPYNTKLFGQGEMIKRSGRLFTAKAKIMDENKNILAELEGTYMILSANQITGGDSFSKEEDVNFIVPDNVTEIDL